MFDFHMHTTVSFDGHGTPGQMLRAAERRGLKEICFTDHRDYVPGEKQDMVFDFDAYEEAYDNLTSSRLKIRLGVEMGLKEYDQPRLREDLARRRFDFVLGSVHFVDETDVYFPEFWQGRTVEQAEQRFLEQTLACVEANADFDVLAHLTYLSKARPHPAPRAIHWEDHREIGDEILKILVKKGKGLELNTSGRDKGVGFLPEEAYFRRFRELGGQIVTIGSDAHGPERVGQYGEEACALLRDIFGYVCTFEDRQPIFHKL